MRKSQILATVSAIALSTAAAVPMLAVITTPARAEVTIDWSFLVVNADVDVDDAAIVLATEEENINSGVIVATVANSVVPIAFADYVGGTDNLIVDKNEATSTAIGNLGLASIDLFVVTGTDGAVSGAAEINRGLTSIDSKVDAVDIYIASEDLGAGSSQTVDENLIAASTTGNDATSILSGNVNALLVSAEEGIAAIGQGSAEELVADGTLMVASMQINDNLSSFTAGVTTSRIGSIAYSDGTDTTALDGIPLSIEDNTISATLTGNDANNLLQVLDGKDVVLEATLGVSNAQLNETDAMVLKASVVSSDIEAGDTTTTDDPIDNLDGSSIDFSSNDILASATASAATSALVVDGVFIDGSFPVGSATQDHTINTNVGNVEGHTRAYADVYVASLQFNEATVTALVGDVRGTGDTEDGDLNVLVEDVIGSTVQAGDTKLLGKANDGVYDGNRIIASARGNVVDNSLTISGTASYSALTGLGSTQNTDGGNKQIASTNGDMTVSVATLDEATGVIDASSVVADGNVIASEAVTNIGSNGISIDATTVTGASIDPDETNEGFMARSWRSNLVASASTDIALVSNQHVENSTVTSDTTGSFVLKAADIGGVIGAVTDSSLSVSGNTASALTIGNTIGENEIEVDATTFAASVALVSAQVVQDNAGAGVIDMSAELTGSDDAIDLAVVDVTSNALTTTNSKFDVDSNAISAQVYGNLVSGSTNAIRIDGVTVGDNDMGSRTAAGSTADVDIGAVEAVVDRNIESDDLPQTTVNSGIALLSEQSFEDSGLNTVSASIVGDDNGDLFDVNIGSVEPGALVSSVDLSVDDNDVVARVRLNSANSAIEIGQNAKVGTLDANITLVNTQTFWDEFGVPDGAGSVYSLIDEAEIDIGVASFGDINDLDLTANGNEYLAEARISGATNAVAVSTQTQVVTGLIAGADIQSVNIGDDKSTVRSEVGLVNDQDFNGLLPGPDGEGISAIINESDIWIAVDIVDGSLLDSVVEADGNNFRALALGNDATNALALDFGTVDLDDALIGGGSGNAPLAIISNAQRGSDADDYSDAGFWAEFDDNQIGIDLNATISIENVQSSVDGNEYEALARVNNGKNVLDVTGGSYEAAAAATPLVQAYDIPVTGGVVAAEDLAFGIASYQTNGYDVEAWGEDTEFYVDVSGDVTIDASKFSVSNNTLLVQGRSNDNINDASVTFTTNEVSAFVANVQAPGADEVDIQVTGEDIHLYVDGFDTTATDTSVDVDGNEISLMGSANRALFNALSLDGTNLTSGTGVTTPLAAIDPNGVSADVRVVADASVLNVQGPPEIASDNDEDVDVYGEDISLSADFDVFSSGAISVNNNLLRNQGIIDSANNLLGMGTAYTYDDATGGITLTKGSVANISASGSIISQQIVSDDSEVTVEGEDTFLEIDVTDISAGGAVALSVSKNTLLNEAVGGTVLNRMDVTAGATITGAASNAAPAVIGDLTTGNPITGEADFNIVNYQAGEPEAFAAGEDSELSIEIGSDATGDLLTVSGNTLESRATGFNAANVLVLNAGASSDVTAAVVNRQDIANTNVDAEQDDDDFGIELFIDGDGNGADTSSLRLDDNAVSSTSSGNVALNAISTTAGATLQESSAAGITITPGDPTVMAPTGSDYTVLNYQSFTDSTSEASVDEVSIYIDDFGVVAGVDDSSMSVNDNTVTAAATANRAENHLVLNTGTFQHPSAIVGNLQTTDGGTVSATVSDVFIGIGNGNSIATTSNNSSFTVQGNKIGSTAIGNYSNNSISSGLGD